MKRNTPGVDIVIFNYNGLDDTKACLRSLLKTKYLNLNIFVIDDASQKDEISELKNIFGSKRISFIRGKRNKNYAFRANQALRLTRNKYVVLLNNDTEVESDWLKGLVDSAEGGKRVVVCQPKIKSLNSKNMFEYAGGSGGFIDRLGYPFTRGRVVFHVENDYGQYNDESEIFWASGTAMLINRNVAKKIGGFDEKFIAYAEETDFCWRLIKKGYKIKVVPRSVVYHKGAASWKHQSARKTFLIHRNHFALLFKHLPLQDLLWLIPLRVFMDYLAIIYYLYFHGLDQALAVIRAHASLILALPKFLKDRSKNYPLRFSPFSIVWEYFVFRRRTFKKLLPNGQAPFNKKLIAYVILNAKKATGNKVIFGHVNKLVVSGYNVIVYTILGGRQRWYDLKAPFKSFLKSYTDSTPDILVPTFWPTSYFSFIMKAKKRIYFSQEWEEDFYKNPIMRLLARLTYTLPLDKVVISKYLLNRIKRFDRSGNDVKRVKYATLNSSIFKPRKNIFKKGTNDGRVKVLSVISWYNKHKGPDLLAYAAKKLKVMHPGYQFTLVSLEKKPYDRVFDRFVSDPDQRYLAKLYREADVFLITSRSEGFFIPGLEAMASGCPVVTTNCRGILDYANQENAVILKSLKDLWEEDVIQKTIEDKEKLGRMIKLGYKTSQKFDSRFLIKDIEKIYAKSIYQ